MEPEGMTRSSLPLLEFGGAIHPALVAIQLVSLDRLLVCQHMSNMHCRGRDRRGPLIHFSTASLGILLDDVQSV